jgi:phosphoribosyl 1,2-cyclic phosphodiesterase
MSLLVASLNSGSNGNCYYISNGDEAVLIDCGIPAREIERRMKRLGLSIRKVQGVFISHEHGDHVSGTNSLAKKFSVPVYITPRTFQYAHLKIKEEQLRFISSNDTVRVGNLTIESFAKSHDAVDPVSFTVKSATTTVGVFTDLGFASEPVIAKFRDCHAAFLEANYDEAMLEYGHYPYHLKERIRGNLGHLSNLQALQLLNDHRPEFMSHVFLSHLSKHNNSPKVVTKVFEPLKEHLEVVIAPRQKETPLYHIRGGGSKMRALAAALPAEQLTLF